MNPDQMEWSAGHWLCPVARGGRGVDQVLSIGFLVPGVLILEGGKVSCVRALTAGGLVDISIETLAGYKAGRGVLAMVSVGGGVLAKVTVWGVLDKLPVAMQSFRATGKQPFLKRNRLRHCSSLMTQWRYRVLRHTLNFL